MKKEEVNKGPKKDIKKKQSMIPGEKIDTMHVSVIFIIFTFN